MYITTKNAHEFVGKKLDAKKRRFHDYPLEVIEHNGIYRLKGSCGVCTRVPAEEDKFNQVYFDIVN